MKSVFDALVIDGILAADELNEARKSNESSGGSVAVHLVLRGAIDEDTLASAFVAHTGTPRATPEEVAAATPDAFSLIPLEMIDRGGIVPLERTADGWLVVGVVDPTEARRLEGTNFLAGLKIAPRIVTVFELATIYERHAGCKWRVPLKVLEGHRSRRAQAARAVASATRLVGDAPPLSVQIVALNDEFSQPAIHLIPSPRSNADGSQRQPSGEMPPIEGAARGSGGGTLPFVGADANARRSSVVVSRPAIPVTGAAVPPAAAATPGRMRPGAGGTLRMDALTPVAQPSSEPANGGVAGQGGADSAGARMTVLVSPSERRDRAAEPAQSRPVSMPGTFARLEAFGASLGEADPATRSVVRTTIASVAACTTREAVAREVCDCIGLVVPNAVLFSLRAPRLVVWSACIARGTDRFVSQGFELGMAPIWQRVIDESVAWRGALPADDPFRAMLGRDLGEDTLLVPIVLRDRPVCILLLDAGYLPALPPLGALVDSLAGHVSDALRRVILVRKRSTQTTS